MQIFRLESAFHFLICTYVSMYVRMYATENVFNSNLLVCADTNGVALNKFKLQYNVIFN